MKNKITNGFLAVLVLFSLAAPALFAEEEFKGVSERSGEDYWDPSVFEGDTDLPGERAPENMPMDDAPESRGVGIEF